MIKTFVVICNTYNYSGTVNTSHDGDHKTFELIISTLPLRIL